MKIMGICYKCAVTINEIVTQDRYSAYLQKLSSAK